MHAQGIDEPTQDELFIDAVDAIVLDALTRLGDDPSANFAFCRRLLAVATSSHSRVATFLGRASESWFACTASLHIDAGQ
jgi:hypothetical protein